jgi:transcriptional regulator with XRE-family HTH domain
MNLDERHFLRELARRPRGRREDRGRTQADLAERCGLHRTFVGSVERGERNVSVLNLRLMARALRVAFRRWNVEHGIRLGKSEIGFRHFEGRNYVALMRHLTLCCVPLTFVAGQAERLRGGKPGGDGGAVVPGAERGVRGLAGGAAGDESAAGHGGGHRLPPAAEPSGQGVEAAPAARPARQTRAGGDALADAPPPPKTTSEAA